MPKRVRKRWLGAISFCVMCGLAPAVPLHEVRAQQPSAATAWPPELIANLEKLRDAALSSDYAYRQAAHLTENIGPRLSGSPQAQQAVEYVSAELRRLGLDVKLQKIMVPHWVRGEEQARLTVFPGQAPGTAQKIVLTALGYSAATPPEGIDAEVVVVNNFDELTALGREKVAGRIVLFNERYDTQMAAEGEGFTAYEHAIGYRVDGAKAAKELGAVASLIRSIGNADYRLPHTGTSRAAGIPAAAVTAEDADLLADLTRQGRVVMHLLLTPQTLEDAASYNVIADLKGSEHPEQIVIASGHLDSWDLGTGAIDDAAGVAVAMQTANLCKQLGLRPKRTLRIIAWMNEENGSRGANAYADEYKPDMANHMGAIESDAGAGHPIGFQGTVKPATAEILRPLAKILAPIGADILRNTDDYEADVEPMAVSGVPLFGLIQDSRTYFSYHHTAADTLDKIHPRELAENAAAMAVLSYALADMPQTLPH
ncbi:MAG TPA: M20/M25/M40 family metallo-hydrolase [Candidatus Acidoferrum sp.]|nr:M20/M25/M40 family metallo-hydrolase [Candidatus Acidoferrum sp.]